MSFLKMKTTQSPIWSLVIAAGLLAPAHAQQPTTIALVGGMLINGQNVAPMHNAVVVIQGDRIVQVGPAARVKVPQGATIIDTTGQTMLPGLIDAHVHLILVGWGEEGGFFEWLKPRQAEYPIERVMAISAYQLLMSGVTSAIDVGGPAKESVDLRERINRGEVPGSRIIVSGPLLARFAYRGFPPDCTFVVTSPEQAAAEVDKLAAMGVDVIKAHAG